MTKNLTSSFQKSLLAFFVFFILFHSNSFAACTGTTITWGGATSTWNTAGNWSPANIPNLATEDVVINSGTVTSNATLTVGCITLSGAGAINGSSSPARVLTFRGDSFTAPSSSSLVSMTNLSLTMGPHLTAGSPQTFSFNQAATLKALTVANASVPGGGVYGATVINNNAGTAVFTTLANTGLNSSLYSGNIRATTYTNNKANSLDIDGTFQVNSLSSANTLTGGSLNVLAGSTFKTTTTFNPVAGFTTTVDDTATLTATTTAAPAGTLNMNGVMTTTSFNPAATSSVTIGSTGSITSSGACTPVGTLLDVSGSLTCTTFAPTKSVTIQSGGNVTATTSSIPTGTTLALSVSGTLTTPTFSPTASGVGSSITVNSGGVIEATTISSPATNMTIAAGGVFNSDATGRTFSPSAGTTDIYGTMNIATLNSTGGTTNVRSGGLLAVTTTATPGGTLSVTGDMTTPVFNPKTGSIITIPAGGNITVATSSAPVGTASVSVTGTLTTPTYNPASTGTTTINSGGLLDVTTSATPAGNITVAAGGTFTTPTYSPTSTSTTNVSGTMNVTTFSPGAGAKINVLNGGVLNVTNFNPQATTVISVAAGGTLNIVTLNDALAATVTIAGTVNITNMPTISSGLLSVSSGGKLNFINGVTLASSGFSVAAGGILEIGNNQTVTINAGVTLTTPIYAPTGTNVTTLINATATLSATTSCTPSATSIFSIYGTLRSPLLSSIAGASVIVYSGGLLNTTTSASPASDIWIQAGGTFTNAGAYSPQSPSVTTLDGTMTATSLSGAAGSTVNVNGTSSPVLTISGATTHSGILNINGAMRTNTFNTAAGSTTNVAALETLTVVSTSAPAGTVNVSGTITTTQYNPTAVSTTTVASGGTITSTGACTPLGILDIAGTLTCTTFAPTKIVTIQSGGLITASTSSIPTGTTLALSVSGTLTTPTFSPTASGVGSSITINSGGKIQATTTSSPATKMTIASGGTFTSPTYSPTSTSTTNNSGTMTVTTLSPGAGATINVKNGGVTTATTFTPNGTSVNTIEAGGTLNVTTMTNTLAATVNIFGTMAVTNMPTMTSGTLDIKSGGKLSFANGITLNNAAATLKVQGGGKLEIANTKTITLGNGSFQILGTEDSFPQNIATKGIVEAPTGSFNFTTTGGTLSLTGFNFNRLGVNGLVIGGSTVVTNLRGGQFTNLSTNYASVKVIQLNTTGTIPASASTIAWNWGNFNDFTGSTPASSQGYKLVSSTGCGSQTIDFSGWTGDWYESQPTFDVTTKISTVATCSINMGASSSAVNVLFFSAVPFNGAIDLRWQTNAERNHLGFNVYRSDIYSAKFQQVNKTLLRNLKNAGSNQASYRFIDQDVTNGQMYYYYIEDVEVSGKKTLHGPVTATAMASLGNPPADNANENSQTNPNDPNTTDGSPADPTQNPDYEDLGNGIKILSKTNHSLRLEIVPGAPVFTASAWNSLYQDVSIPGYSKMTLEGSPELPDKEILIEVKSFAKTAEVIKATVLESSFSGHLIAPAPSYLLDSSGVLVPGYHPDSSRYEQSNFYPANYYSVQTELVAIGKEKFLKLKINPLKLNPVTKMISMSSKIILDIGFDGDDWDVNRPDVNSNLGPYSVSNVLKIDYGKSGIYQISYDDFVSSHVDGPFDGTQTSEWRLYYKNGEIPLEIHSANGQFSPGDYIRFYAPFTKELESRKNQIILSPVDLLESHTDPKRIELADVSPEGQEESNEVSAEFTKTLEQNLKYIDGVTLNDHLDHFFYADLVNYPGMDTLSVTAALPEIDVNNNRNVLVKYHVRPRLTMAGMSIKHHAAFMLGNIQEGEIAFEGEERQVLTFEVPADHFVKGNNTLKFKVLGTYARPDENEFVLVDKIEIIYPGFSAGPTGVNNFRIHDSLKVHQLSNFSTNLVEGYDVTFPLNPKKLFNMAITSSDGGETFAARFLVDEDADDEGLKSYSLMTSTSFFKPTGLSLNPGIEKSLKNSSNRADLIVYGSESLIMALHDLIDQRIADGLEVMTVTPAEVYSEFSFGVQKSSALKDFMNTALTNWEKAPAYLLILGDGTFDPLDYNVGSLAPNLRSALHQSTLPAPIIPGRFIDFSADNYFVSAPDSHLPKLTVGRLPTNDPNKIKAYVEKVKNYEEGGAAAPTTYLKDITFFADEDTGNYEHFNLHSRNMISAATGFTTLLYDRADFGSKALTKAKMRDEFSRGPLMISMMGHGAYDRFGDDIFNVSDARILTNEVYPIVVNWNCESAYFYDANNSYKSLAEEMIFNPNGGAIVYMGSTTQTTPSAQGKLAQNFFSRLSSAISKPWDGIRLGEVLYQAKIGVGNDLYHQDIVNSFSIIGDPSLKLPSNLFPEGQTQNLTAAASEQAQAGQKKGGFGCTANASDGTDKAPWAQGLIELIFYMLLIVYGIKKLIKN